jgi:hypothetical protein
MNIFLPKQFIKMTSAKVGLEPLISESLHLLKKKGYLLECRREATCLYCFEWHQYIFPTQFNVDSTHYFEYEDNPDEDRVIYAVSLSQGGKGYFIEACNVYTDNISPAMMQKLKFKKIVTSSFY